MAKTDNIPQHDLKETVRNEIYLPKLQFPCKTFYELHSNMGLVTLRGHVRMQIRGPIVHENVQKGKQEMPTSECLCDVL